MGRIGTTLCGLAGLESTMRIRNYRSGDAEALAQLFFDSVRQVGRRYYSQAQVEAWAPEPPSAAWVDRRSQDGRTLLVAADDRDAPIGYIDLEPDGHIDHMFCRPDHAGRGVGSALYDALEAVARERRLARLYVEASEAARALFGHKGFTLIRRRDFELRGEPIHHYLMERTLSGQP